MVIPTFSRVSSEQCKDVLNSPDLAHLLTTRCHSPNYLVYVNTLLFVSLIYA